MSESESEAVESLAAEAGAALNASVPSEQVPGLVFGLAKNGVRRIEAIGTTGLAEDGSAPMREDAIFRIASLTKPVTALVTLMLAEEGAFTLDEPVDRLLPELRDRRVLRDIEGPVDDTVPAERPIITRDLLTCGMGLGMLTGRPSDAPRPPILDLVAEKGLAVTPNAPPFADADAYLAALAELPLMAQPGAAFLYDTGITTLGALLERAVGERLPDLYRRRIFEPLGMIDTGFHTPAEKLDRLPPSYRSDPETGAARPADPAGAASRYASPPGFATAAAGLVSTAADYLTFLETMAAGGVHNGRRMVSEASLRAMTTDQVPPAQRRLSSFGHSFWERQRWGYGIAIRTAREPGDPQGIGWDGGRGATALWDPRTGLSALLFTQRLMDGPAVLAVFKTFWKAIQGEPTP